MASRGRVGLGIDIGGSGIKGAPVDLDRGTFVVDRVKIATPQPATPEAVAAVVIMTAFCNETAEANRLDAEKYSPRLAWETCIPLPRGPRRPGGPSQALGPPRRSKGSPSCGGRSPRGEGVAAS